MTGSSNIFSGRIRRAVVLAALALPGLGAGSGEALAEPPREVILWHSYRGAEAEALGTVVDGFNGSRSDLKVTSLMVPNEVLASKLTTAIPRGNGPDLFIFAHERIGGWAQAGITAALDEEVTPEELEAFFPETVSPLRYEGELFGLPLAFKSLALFYNKALVEHPPATTDEMVEIARGMEEGTFGLAFETGTGVFYYHAPWLFGFGGEIFGEGDRLALDSPEALASYEFLLDLRAQGVMPEEVSGALVGSLFNKGQVGMVVNGPWFTGEISKGIDFGVAPLPVVSATGLPARPFLTDEAVFVSAYARSKPDALVFARHLAARESALVRAKVGRQAVANVAAWDDPEIARDPVLAAFRTQLPATVPTDNRPAMLFVWESAKLLLQKVLRGDATPEEAARAALRRHAAISGTSPPAANGAPYLVLGIAFVLAGLAFAWRRFAAVSAAGEVRPALRAWTWIAPAAIATGILIFLPFAVGLCLSLFNHNAGTWTFVGLANFFDILSARTFGPMEPLSFYYALLVTVLWTVVNLSLHVGIGLGLALVLNRPLLQLKPVYRVLLIVPWAVPNYITALIWKGLFHKQFGAINGMLERLGIEGVSWFSSFWTAFFANVCTNAWLGFPFMMVVALGALQSIPKDLYEAADVDGAGWWAKLKHITLPLLTPAMIPAVLLGMVWTFNQFNIVYLVSGGEPDNSTDILISEAYRWAFARQGQYGYAAAYAAMIFVVLLVWSALSARIARATEALR